MNWGHKLTFTILVFIGLMSYLVYRSLNTDFQLVEKDYYNNELQYQQVIDAAHRTNELKEPVHIRAENNLVFIEMPAEMKNAVSNGKLWFYCAYDSKRDRKFSFEPDENGVQVFERSQFEPGNYTVKISWSHRDENYYKEIQFSL